MGNFRQNLVLAVLAGICALPAFAREQWQMQHPSGPAPTGPITNSFLNDAANQTNAQNGAQGGSFAPGLVAPAGQNSGAEVPGLVGGTNPYTRRPMVPPPDAVKRILANRIGEGTVLTGVMGDDLSSRKSLPGDLFSIVLPDGYCLNGVDVIPRNARIIGTVVSVAPAHMQRGVGTGGHLEVGLTTLVFPDGRSTKFRGHIERNPANDLQPQSKSQSHGLSLGSYGSSLNSMFSSFTNGFGAVRKNTDRGLDFEIKSGIAVPIRVTAALDLSQMTPPAVGISSPAPIQAMPPQPNQDGSGAPLTSPGPITLPKELPDPF